MASMTQVSTERPPSQAATADFSAVPSWPTRIAVLRLMMDDECCIIELADTLGIAQPRLADHHLVEILYLGEILAALSEDDFATCPALRREQSDQGVSR